MWEREVPNSRHDGWRQEPQHLVAEGGHEDIVHEEADIGRLGRVLGVAPGQSLHAGAAQLHRRALHVDAHRPTHLAHLWAPAERSCAVDGIEKTNKTIQ